MDNKLKLLQLIEELKLPIIEENAVEFIEKLTGEELTLLITRLQALVDYKNEVENAYLRLDTKRYGAIEDEYLQKFTDLEEVYINRMEQVQKNADSEVEKIIEKSLKDHNKNSKDSLLKVDRLVNENRNFHSTISKTLSSGISNGIRDTLS